MPLPKDFSDSKHIQNVCINYVNKIVREDFRDLGDDSWEPTIGTSRESLRTACTHKAGDSLIITVSRLLTYYIVVDGARKLHPAIYGIPTPDFQEDVSFRPAVYFYFQQDSDAVPEGKTPIQARFTFRLVNETSASINETKAIALAREIKRIFAPNGYGYTFTKGKFKCTYLDKHLGYDFRINTNGALEGELLVKRFLEIQSDIYKEECFTVHTPKRDSINNPMTTRLVYGKRKPTKRWRPVANVRFIYASLQIDGEDEDQMLVDTRGKHTGALV